MRNWTLKFDRQHTISQLFQVFQRPGAPEVLALALANIFLLWNLNPLPSVDEFQLLTSNLLDLRELLSGRKVLSHSYELLLDLSASFCDVVKVCEADSLDAIIQFVLGAICCNESGSPSEELTEYYVERLTGKDSDLDILVEGFVLL